jgi:CRISPR/Cas system-associated endonuclease Cas1
MFKDEIVDRVVGSSIGRRRGESKKFDGSVVAGGSKVLIRRVESNSLDMTLVDRESF